MANAHLTVNGREIMVEVGALLSTSIGLSEHFEMPCGGHGRCGKCKVIAQGALSAMSEQESALLSVGEIEKGVRLACLTRIEGDCRVILPESEGASVSVLTGGRMPSIAHAPRYSGYLFAIDIGTTTLAMKLFDPSGAMVCPDQGDGWGRENPQIALGGDVVARMEAAMAGRGSELAFLIRHALDGMIRTAIADAGICAEQIGGGVITGNTVMLSLLTEMDVEGMTHSPFTPPSLFGYETCCGDLGLTSLSPETPVALPPCIAAFLGADLVCAILGSEMTQFSQPSILADIGTNGEMALWDGDALYTTSTAAGPAFEGGGISMGMRGEQGAIDRVTLCGSMLSCHVIGEGSARGICGSGLIDALSCMLQTGDLDFSGYLEEDPFDLTDSVQITGRDIRMVQQAKSPICAGIETLLASCGRDEEEMPLYLAGGFGRYLNPISAGGIGLIPAHLVSHVKAIGNAALIGASMLALSKPLWDEAIALSRRADIVSLAGNPEFSSRFMEGMLFPDPEEE